MQAKAIVFGINGQDGFYLNELLTGAGIEVLGVSRSNSAYTMGDVAIYISRNIYFTWRPTQPQGTILFLKTTKLLLPVL
jgi:hypothetical protein